MPRPEIRISGLKKTNAKFRQIRTTLRGKHAPKAVDAGYEYAKKHAPVARDRYGGGTRAAIRRVKRKMSAQLILDQPWKRPGRRPYHFWMHNLGRYDISGYIKTGDPFFMFTARKIIEKDLNKRLKKQLSKK